MSAEVVGKAMPATITLADLAEMNDADRHGHRYEMSPEGALSVVPPPDSGHAVVASRVMAWLITAGWPAEQVLQAVGIRIPGPEGDGGRTPDLTVWARPQPRDSVWCTPGDLVLVVEIISRGSAVIDQSAKVVEYAAAGIPQYWMVGRDTPQTVTMYRLGPDGTYELGTKIPLSWLLRSAPAEHGLG